MLVMSSLIHNDNKSLVQKLALTYQS